MISAKLMKELEKKGFELDFPGYDRNEEAIIEIIKENNPRLNLAIPLLLRENFDYKKIIEGLGKDLIKEFNRIITIADKLFILEGIDNRHLTEMIKKNRIKEAIKEEEFRYHHGSFRDSLMRAKEEKEELLKEQIRIRGKLNLNKALSNIFSPGKIRIMEKIFNHERLTDTELKYYYRSIRPLDLAMLNDNLQRYILLIESTKKYRM